MDRRGGLRKRERLARAEASAKLGERPAYAKHETGRSGPDFEAARMLAEDPACIIGHVVELSGKFKREIGVRFGHRKGCTMGFQLRKRMKAGPLRFNFGKSEKKDKSALVGKLVAVGIVLLVILSLGLLSGCGGDSTAASSISGEPVQSRKSPLESVTAAASQLEKPAEGEKPAAEPAPTPEPEKPAAEPASAQEPEEGPVVIGNKNSKKYHELGCSSIEDMKESNRIELESAAVAEAGGYKPCARCHSGK